MFIKLFLFWLITLPFVVWKTGYEGPKVAYFFFGAFCLSVFWIKKILSDLNSFELGKIDKIYFLWICTLLVSSIFGIHPLDSIIGGSYRHQGLIFFIGLWLVGKTISILDAAQKKFLVKAIAASVMVECVIVGLQILGGNLYFGKALGTLGEPNAVAGFIVIGSYLVLEYFPNLLLAFSVGAMLLLQSRSATLAFLPFFYKFNKKLLIIASVTLLAIVIFAMNKNASVFENRPLIWKLGISQVLQRPLLGYGAESGEGVYDLAYKGAGIPLVGLIVDRAHNLFLDIAIWSGFVGLAMFVYWLYLSLQNLEKLNWKLAFAALFIFAMFQPLGITHWILLVLLFST